MNWNYRYYSVRVIGHIVLLIILGGGCYILMVHRLWFSMIIAVLLLIATGVHLYTMQMKLAGMMLRLVKGIRYNDMMQTFQTPYKNKIINALSQELTLTLGLFRKRLLDEEIKHQYYGSLLDKVDTAVLVVDRSGQIEWMNHAAGNMLGQESRLPAGILENGIGEEHIVRIERGGIMMEVIVSSIQFSVQGKNQYLISLKNIHSVLERNEMEAWQKLIRVLTHEIMNSITPIISLSETLSERGTPLSATDKEYAVMLQAMQTIHRRSKGLLSFVENYRTLTRIPEPLYAQVPVFELFDDLKKLFPDASFCFYPVDNSEFLFIDRTLIEQILINLLKNAKEACCNKPEPAIKIKFIPTDGKTSSIAIKDNGEGILPEVMDKIFVPFFTTKTSGSGIGLSLCKQIINLHGGTISVSSKPNHGSCFTVVFPTLPSAVHTI